LKRRSTADLAHTYAGRAIPAPASVASTVGSCEVEATGMLRVMTTTTTANAVITAPDASA
jgi:hypothetical protein